MVGEKEAQLEREMRKNQSFMSQREKQRARKREGKEELLLKERQTDVEKERERDIQVKKGERYYKLLFKSVSEASHPNAT